MKTLTQQLSQYAGYHRNRTNVATHMVGVPMIVFAVVVLLSRPVFATAGVIWSPAVVAMVAATAFYLRLDLRYGVVMGALLALAVAGAAPIAAGASAVWLATGVGLFVIGWIIQFVGHHHEGRKPAFVDDVIGLLIGPLFILAEVGFLLGWRRDLQTRLGGHEHTPSAALSGRPGS